MDLSSLEQRLSSGDVLELSEVSKCYTFCEGLRFLFGEGGFSISLLFIIVQWHATMSATKAFVTELVTFGIETCRRACGGHGYLNNSGIPELYCTDVQNVTAEGDNTVLAQQTARFLLKVRGVARILFTLFIFKNENVNNIFRFTLAFRKGNVQLGGSLT